MKSDEIEPTEPKEPRPTSNPKQANNASLTFDKAIEMGEYNPEYLSGFPEWLKIVQNSRRVFPAWNPAYDAKKVLIEAYQRRPELFAKTEAYRDQKNGFVKGRGYSSNAVVYEGVPVGPITDLVWQEDQTSVPMPSNIGFDTSANKPVLIEKPKSKFNVWVIGNMVVGIMASMSDSKIISDKDFNCVPIII